MSSRNCPPLLSLCLLLLGFCLCPAQQTENIFIVNIDGLRCTEGLDLGRANMPFVWDSLRPLGTLYTNFYNTGITVTNSAHSTIVTGVRQMMENAAGALAEIRPRDPTIGEYYRKYRGAPTSKAVFVTGKFSIWNHPVSTLPGFGYAWAPTIVYGNDNDRVVWDSTQAVIDRWHPRLCYVLFGEVDHDGHSGDTARYIGAIKQVDSLIWLLWNKLQCDSFYRNRTTVMLTSDHGRHNDAHGGWQEHGCACRGCRRVMFLAIGPEIKANTVITAFRDHDELLALRVSFETRKRQPGGHNVPWLARLA